MFGQMNEIERLLPHRGSFLFVDRILSASKHEIVGVKTFDSTNAFLRGSFPGHDYVPGMILIESMAQCGGAGIRKLGIADGVFALVSIIEVKFLRAVNYDTPVIYKIRNHKIGEKLISQSGIALYEHETAVEGSWMSMKMEERS